MNARYNLSIASKSEELYLLTSHLDNHKQKVGSLILLISPVQNGGISK